MNSTILEKRPFKKQACEFFKRLERSSLNIDLYDNLERFLMESESHISSNARVFEKLRKLIFKSLAYRERCISFALLSSSSFDHWRWSTSAFRRWITEPLHPAFYIKKIKG